MGFGHFCTFGILKVIAKNEKDTTFVRLSDYFWTTVF